MKEIKIENITLSLSDESGSIRVKSNGENIILTNQNIDAVSALIIHNFNIISNYYKSVITKENGKFDLGEINHVSITIVLYYLYMYNSWKSLYKKQENKDLRFNDKDFVNPSTYDIIFKYFKKRYPNDWEEKCAVLLGMELSELKAYYKTREEFYNK